VIDAVKFLSLIEHGQLEEAIAFSCSEFPQYRNEQQKYSIRILSVDGSYTNMPVVNLTSLLCYRQPQHSEFAFLFSAEQKSILADTLNNEILSKPPPHIILKEFGNKHVGKGPLSTLERIMQHLSVAFTMGENTGKRFVT
jgi:hypothetical protein